MRVCGPRPLSDFPPAGLHRWVNLAARAVAAMERMDGDVEVRIGEPSFRIGLPAEVVRDALQRHVDEARASLAWRVVLG